jgi:hypothetical protein
VYREGVQSSRLIITSPSLGGLLRQLKADSRDVAVLRIREEGSAGHLLGPSDPLHGKLRGAFRTSPEAALRSSPDASAS